MKLANNAFEEFLKHNSEVVASWPEWKRNASPQLMRQTEEEREVEWRISQGGVR